MSIQNQLFEGKLVRFTPLDYEKDPEVESRWTHNAAYMRNISLSPMRPASPAQIKKRYEALEKEVEESKNMFYFAVRTQPKEGEESRLIGFAKLTWIEWTHGNANLQFGIGDPQEWGHGYGTDILRLLERYAFDELNMFRLSAVVPEYNVAAAHLLEKEGFVLEVRRREAANRDGQRWDMLHYGLLQEEWQARQGE